MATVTQDFRMTRYMEVRTGQGQLLRVRCAPADADKVHEILSSIATLDIEEPQTKRVQIPHGSYGQYTRYDIVQHKYAGGGGYIEVLEIKDPPELKWGIVIHEWNPHFFGGSVFTEWATVEDAINAFSGFLGSPDRTVASFPTLKGFKRRVVCGALTPWFYAIGDQELIGDYAFPEGLQDDPVYGFGKKFVVFDNEGTPTVKTCMGTRFLVRKTDSYPFKESHSRLVYWDDGTTWDESRSFTPGKPPRPLEEGELWIDEALGRFRGLLAGRSTDFAIDFTDGTKFVGRVARSKSKAPCAEGRYDVVAYVKGQKPEKGWVDFKPSPKFPDVVHYVTKGLAARGLMVERVEIKQSEVAKGGKKWAGVFFSPSTT